MAIPFVIRLVRLVSGERLPLLLERSTGQPLLEPTLFVLTELRGVNRASATIEQAERAVMLLLLFLEAAGIDLAERMDRGRFLEIRELEGLAAFCRRPLRDISLASAEQEKGGKTQPSMRAPNPENFRCRAPAPWREVDPRTAGIRLFYIHGYLRWMINTRMAKLSLSHPTRAHLEEEATVALTALRARMPSSKQPCVEQRRQGLPPESLARLAQVIALDSPVNPWKSIQAKERNHLIIQMLWRLGIRRGEILGIKISDINFRSNEILIARRADDPADPRTNQPNAKTGDRLLPISDELSKYIRKYILETRLKTPTARRHEFLFVAVGTGTPLSLSALNKIFKEVRYVDENLFKNISPHVLRHTWNDAFSKTMDEAKVPIDIENKMRSYLMGWSETSTTVSTYTRRHIRTKARIASQQLQKSMLQIREDNDN